MTSLTIALTGGIGSGKSAAAEMFGELGAVIIDADVISHELTGPQGAAMPAIRAEFGAEVVGEDGALDRAAMRRLAFADATARRRLETLLHPMIRAESEARTHAAGQAGAPYLMLVIPLLVESGEPRTRASRILVIDCPEALQIARVMSRSKLDEPEVHRIMAVQASRTQRLAVADDVIVNDGDLVKLRNQVTALHRKYLECAGK